MFSFRSQKSAIAAFFLLWLAASQLLVKDVGVTWDEYAQRHHGMVVIDTLNRQLGYPLGHGERTQFDLASYPFRYHGLLFTTIGVAVQEALHVTDAYDIYQVRHRLNALLFWVAGIFFYRMLMLRFQDRRLAFIGVLFLVLSPRIFADSFNNPKDMVFMPFYLISGYTLLRLLDRPTWGRAVWHGLAMSLAFSSRLVGLMLPVMTIAVMLVSLLCTRHQPQSVRRNVGMLAVCLCSFAVFSYIWWPALWGNFAQGVRELGQLASAFKWDKEILYRRTFYPAGTLPWHYLPTWIGLTTPPLYLVLMIAGFAFIGGHFVRWTKSRNAEQFPGLATDSVWLLLGLAPLLTGMFSHPIIYDGWRHFYFVYPFLLAVAMVGLDKIFRLPPVAARPRWVVAIVIAVCCIPTVWTMVRLYPNQQVYFNALAGHNVQWRYDVDYWGASYRQALEKLAELDESDRIIVTAENYPGMLNAQALNPELRRRFAFTQNQSEATYYLTNFRGADELEALRAKRPPFDREVYVFSTSRADYMGIYRLK